MKRTTVLIPDELADLLDLERRRRDLSTAEIVRQALEAYLKGGPARARKIPFAALGRSGHRHIARDAEAILERGWARDRDR